MIKTAMHFLNATISYVNLNIQIIYHILNASTDNF